MMKGFEITTNRNLVRLVSIAILLLVAASRYFSHGGILFVNPFDHGELVSTLPSILAGHSSYTIHGAMDWIPAWIMQNVVGVEHHFLPTLFFYNFLDAVASALLLAIVFALVEQTGKEEVIILLGTAALAPYLVGIRDVFLLLLIYLFFLRQRVWREPVKIYWVETALGLVLVANVYWSFDRGIAGLIGVGAASLALYIYERKYSVSIWVFCGTLLAIVVADANRFNEYLKNFQLLIQTSSQWSYGYSRVGPVFLTAIVGLINLVALYGLFIEFRREGQKDIQKKVSIMLLAVLCVFLLKIGINRADPFHVSMALWMPIITYVYLRKQNGATLPTNGLVFLTGLMVLFSMRQIWAVVSLAPPVMYLHERRSRDITIQSAGSVFVPIGVAVFLIGVNSALALTNYFKGNFDWVSQLINTPNNQELVEEKIRWVSSELVKGGARCIFDLSNNGIINGVAGLPSCTKYAYPGLASRRYESDILQQLAQSNPPVVVFSSEHNAFSIDGKSMHERFPKVKDYLEKTYPFERCEFGYCLRYINQPNLEN